MLVGNPLSTSQHEVRSIINVLMKTCPSLQSIDNIAIKKEENGEFTYSLTHSLTHWLTHLLIHSLDNVDTNVDIAKSPEYKEKLKLLKKSFATNVDSDNESVDDTNPEFEQAEERNEKR